MPHGSRVNINPRKGMLSFNKLANGICGKIPRITSVSSCVDREFANHN
jgi:hypothetical protein